MSDQDILLTISIQYEADKWWEKRKYQILETNIARTIQQTVRRITSEILGVKGLTQQREKKPYTLGRFNTLDPSDLNKEEFQAYPSNRFTLFISKEVS